MNGPVFKKVDIRASRTKISHQKFIKEKYNYIGYMLKLSSYIFKIKIIKNIKQIK